MSIVFGSKKQYFRGETPIISLFGGASFTSLGAAYFSVICLVIFIHFLKIRTMKRMIMAAMLLVSTVSVFAADVKSEGKKDEKATEVKIAAKEAVECSISITATIGPSWSSVTVTCTGTASNCKEAVVTAKNCIEEAKKAIQ